MLNESFLTIADIIVGNIAVACGHSAYSTGRDGRAWIGDSLVASKSSSFLRLTGKSINSRVPSKLADSAPYTVARVSRHEFTYIFSLTPGQKFIRFHFHPAPYPGFRYAKAFFTVKAGPYTLLSNFSPSYVADALGVRYFHKEFCINMEQNQELHIVFSPSPKIGTSEETYAFINGIEIVSMPTGLYYSRDGDSGVRVVGQRYKFYIDNNTAFAMVHRLNVGGTSIPAAEDWGLFREWLEDAEYFLGAEDVSVNTNIMTKYISTVTPIAPLKVYQIARTTGPNEKLSQLRNLTWKLPVDLGFRYLVRLHFGKTQSRLTDKRMFDVFIDNQVAEADADLIKWGGEPGVAVHRDYILMKKGDKMKGKHDLIIKLHPKSGANTKQAYAALNALEIFRLSNPDNNLASMIPMYPTKSSTSWKSGQGLFWAFGAKNSIATVITFTIALLNVIVYQLMLCLSQENSGKKNSPSGSQELCRQFYLAELQIATNNFNRQFLIGRGGYGNVYKGKINNGTSTSAIKRLNLDSRQGAQEFWNEIKMLSKLRHEHLVSLVGFCNEGQEMILVYEYMARGSLADHLYKIAKTDNSILSWELRLNMCIGAARGLHCLHTNPPTVIHRDVKSSNILLDESWQAKISDFGLSKMGSPGESCTHVSTMVKGSFGYFDPEYFMTRRLTIKSDVYAFGVVLFEVLCGRAAVDTTLEEEQHSLAFWACQCVREGKVDKIIDSSLVGQILPACLKTYVGIAMKCLRKHPRDRPSMDEILSGLEFALSLQQNRASSVEQVLEEVVVGTDDSQSNTEDAQNNQIEHIIPMLPPTKEASTKELHVKGRNTISKAKAKANAKDVGSSSTGQLRMWWHIIYESKIRTLLSASRSSRNASKGSNSSASSGLMISFPPCCIKGSAESLSIPRSGSEIFSYDHLKPISFKVLKKATRNFNPDSFLGEGGFGPVFKGWIDEHTLTAAKPGTKMAVAVKKLNPHGFQGHQEWLTEVYYLGRFHHPNMVKLIGYCADGDKSILVYEFMRKGSLDNYLFRRGQDLSWAVRIKVAIGAARGLSFLHDTKVICRDFKSANILLDVDFNAKLADLGLAKDGPTGDKTYITTKVMGTYGYADPEYIATGQLSTKSDVYSFGVVLLELLSGRRVLDVNLISVEQNLVDWAKPYLGDKQKLFKIMDTKLNGQYPQKAACRAASIALQCLSSTPKSRPRISEVVAALEQLH